MAHTIWPVVLTFAIPIASLSVVVKVNSPTVIVFLNEKKT
jgi:hypothetical protein